MKTLTEIVSESQDIETPNRYDIIKNVYEMKNPKEAAQRIAQNNEESGNVRDKYHDEHEKLYKAWKDAEDEWWDLDAEVSDLRSQIRDLEYEFKETQIDMEEEIERCESDEEKQALANKYGEQLTEIQNNIKTNTNDLSAKRTELEKIENKKNSAYRKLEKFEEKIGWY